MLFKVSAFRSTSGLPSDSHFVIYPLGTEKQWVPQKNNVNIFHKLAYFISRGIGSSQMGQDLKKYCYIDGLVQMDIIMKKFVILMYILWPSF